MPSADLSLADPQDISHPKHFVIVLPDYYRRETSREDPERHPCLVISTNPPRRLQILSIGPREVECHKPTAVKTISAGRNASWRWKVPSVVVIQDPRMLHQETLHPVQQVDFKRHISMCPRSREIIKSNLEICLAARQASLDKYMSRFPPTQALSCGQASDLQDVEMKRPVISEGAWKGKSRQLGTIKTSDFKEPDTLKRPSPWKTSPTTSKKPSPWKTSPITSKAPSQWGAKLGTLNFNLGLAKSSDMESTTSVSTQPPTTAPWGKITPFRLGPVSVLQDEMLEQPSTPVAAPPRETSSWLKLRPMKQGRAPVRQTTEGERPGTSEGNSSLKISAWGNVEA
ncbi:hypothetical protein MMC12_002719 [Toensbergia leucococca]|nr:hypothetical protein [Toensbergia leucococca]